MRMVALAIVMLSGSGLCAAPCAVAQQAPAACIKPEGVESFRSIEQLPKPVQERLHMDAGELSPIGGPFDATDVVGISPPHFRRVLFLWHHGTRWLVASERGGIAYGTPIFLYEYLPRRSYAVRLVPTFIPAGTLCQSALASIIR